MSLHRRVSPTQRSWEKIIFQIIFGQIDRILTAADSLFEDILQVTQRFTKFSFQRWEKEVIRRGDRVEFTVYLPFDTTAGPVPYTSNVWNNPYFEGQLTGRENTLARKHAPWKWMEIHQPLQEALAWFGIRSNPGVGEPITPVKWPKPPQTLVQMNRSDFARALFHRMREIQ